jgi:hypothetical protein
MRYVNSREWKACGGIERRSMLLNLPLMVSRGRGTLPRLVLKAADEEIMRWALKLSNRGVKPRACQMQVVSCQLSLQMARGLPVMSESPRWMHPVAN